MGKIYILWLRQIKRYLRSRSRMLGALAQPTLFLVALGYGLGPIFQKAGQGDYINFLTPGIIGMSIIFAAVFSGMEVIWDKQFGFLKETLVAPVPRFNIMFGRTLGGATMATAQGVLVMVIALLFGFHPASFIGIVGAILVMLLISLLFTSVGTAIASKLSDMQGFQLIMNFLIMPLFFLSGALFPLDGLPPALGVVASVDPLSYGVDAIRALLLGSSHFGLGMDIGILSVITLFFLWLGAYFFKKIQI